MILVVDNYDSFAYNLVQYVAAAVGPDAEVSTPFVRSAREREPGAVSDADPTADVLVRRNDAVSIDDVRRLDPDGIVVSPGPGTPEEAGVCVDLFADLSYPTLGVCLGHQALCAANGVPVGHAPTVVHGKPSVVSHDGQTVFADLPDPLRVGRYHSLAVARDDLPDALVETSRTVGSDGERGIVMGVRHREKPHEGVQFHPESILTGRVDDADDVSLEVGQRLIRSFVDRCTTT